MPLTPDNPTLLVITPLSGRGAFFLPPYAARGLKQTFEPVMGNGSGGSALGSLIRLSVNARPIDLSNPAFHIYITSISCDDTEAPLLDDGWVGEVVEIACAAELSYLTGHTQQRTEVPGSVRTEGHVTFYRPLIVAMITAIKNEFDEYRASYSWRLEAVEVR